MIKINLLSPKDRIDIKLERANKIIISSAAIIIITQLIFVLLLFASIQYLKIESRKLDDRMEELEEKTEVMEIRAMKNKIQGYEEQLECIDQIQENHLYWIKVFDIFIQLIPDEVKISALSITEYEEDVNKKGEKDQFEKDKQYKIVAQGIIKKDDYLKYLLKFERNLKDSEDFELIIGDYLEKNYINNEDARFEFRMLVNKNKVIALD